MAMVFNFLPVINNNGKLLCYYLQKEEGNGKGCLFDFQSSDFFYLNKIQAQKIRVLCSKRKWFYFIQKQF